MKLQSIFRRIGLLGYIFIAILAGIATGWISPPWLVRVFVTFNSLFSQFLGFVIPLLIVGLVAPAIVEIGKGAGKMLLFTVGLAYAATILAGLFSYFTGVTFFPHMIQPDRYVEAAGEAVSLVPYFTIEIVPMMTVTTALVLAFVLGLCVARFTTTALRDVLMDFREVIVMVIRGVIVPLLPLYIFGIFAGMTCTGQVAGVVGTFIKVIGVIFVMHVLLLVFQYLVGDG